MQIFDSRKYSITDIKDWYEKGELDLRPKFQRRSVWVEKARSYLIDTIVRGKPIPKIFIRLRENSDTGRSVREVVDGQQRLKTVLDFLQDGFSINKVHNDEHGNKFYSQLDSKTQKDIQRYEFTIDILMDAPDSEIYDIFARLNRYPVKINDQELRNSQFFGEFKTTTYQLAHEFNTFWQQNQIMTEAQVSRMAEAEFTAELLIAMSKGIKEKSKKIIDSAFREFDDKLPNRINLIKHFRETMDIISNVMQESLKERCFRRVPLFHTLFCAIYHMQYGIPNLDFKRTQIKHSDFPKIRVALEKIDQIFEVDKQDIDKLLPKEKEFRLATDVHTIHAANRVIRIKYVLEIIRSAIQK